MAEADVLRLAMANPSKVTLEALPGTIYQGKVVEIGASALAQVGATGGRARVQGQGAARGRRRQAAARTHLRH